MEEEVRKMVNEAMWDIARRCVGLPAEQVEQYLTLLTDAVKRFAETYIRMGKQ